MIMRSDIFVLLTCWYEGDSNLIDDGYAAVSTDIEKLIEYATKEAPKAEIFLPGEVVPDDGTYGDKRERFRIIKETVL
jgi:hypothetical protein